MKGRCGADVRPLLIAGIAVLLLAGCSPDVPPRPVKLSEWLSDCTPFTSYDGRLELDLRGNRTAKLSAADGRHWFWQKSSDVRGRWTGDERGMAVTLILEGRAPSFLVLYLPGDQQTCILAPGSSGGRVTLTDAWFGTVSNDDQDDQDDYTP